MTAVEILGILGAVIGILTGLVSLAGVVYVAGWKMARLDARVEGIEEKVATIWEFLIRRAMAEAVIKGAATMNSPFVVTEEAKSWMGQLTAELRNFYQRIGHQMTSQELMMEIERRFGDRIVKEVCIPHGLFAGTCLLIATAVAREMADGSVTLEQPAAIPTVTSTGDTPPSEQK